MMHLRKLAPDDFKNNPNISKAVLRGVNLCNTLESPWVYHLPVKRTIKNLFKINK